MQVWYDHATFSMRLGHLEAALSSARSCLEINPVHSGALFLIAAVTLTQAIRLQAAGDHEAPGEIEHSSETNTSLMETSCVAAHALVTVSGTEQGMPWALLAILYSKGTALPIVTCCGEGLDLVCGDITRLPLRLSKLLYLCVGT
jgi:hypothetical protein